MSALPIKEGWSRRYCEAETPNSYFSVGHPTRENPNPNVDLWVHRDGKIETHRRTGSDQHDSHWDLNGVPAWGRADHDQKKVSIAWQPTTSAREKDLIRKHVDRKYPGYETMEETDPGADTEMDETIKFKFSGEGYHDEHSEGVDESSLEGMRGQWHNPETKETHDLEPGQSHNQYVAAHPDTFGLKPKEIAKNPGQAKYRAVEKGWARDRDGQVRQRTTQRRGTDRSPRCQVRAAYGQAAGVRRQAGRSDEGHV